MTHSILVVGYTDAYGCTQKAETTEYNAVA